MQSKRTTMSRKFTQTQHCHNEVAIFHFSFFTSNVSRLPRRIPAVSPPDRHHRFDRPLFWKFRDDAPPSHTAGGDIWKTFRLPALQPDPRMDRSHPTPQLRIPPRTMPILQATHIILVSAHGTAERGTLPPPRHRLPRDADYHLSPSPRGDVHRAPHRTLRCANTEHSRCPHPHSCAQRAQLSHRTSDFF